jgi:pimeloyl-ACP methyl ester carboxylesterase
MELVDTQCIAHGQPRSTTQRVILMPGAYESSTHFLQHGFDLAVRVRQQPLDLILATPRLAHLTDRRWLDELRSRVVEPARADGARVWLGGISLGGFMALRFAAEFPDSVDGLCLIAPYLGSRLVAQELAAQPDLSRRQPAIRDTDDDERRIWQYVIRRQTQPASTRVFLGLGSDDRFADTQQLLARTLIDDRTCLRVVAGGHDWSVWCTLWAQFLDHCA